MYPNLYTHTHCYLSSWFNVSIEKYEISFFSFRKSCEINKSILLVDSQYQPLHGSLTSLLAIWSYVFYFFFHILLGELVKLQKENKFIRLIWTLIYLYQWQKSSWLIIENIEWKEIFSFFFCIFYTMLYNINFFGNAKYLFGFFSNYSAIRCAASPNEKLFNNKNSRIRDQINEKKRESKLE